MGSNTAVDLFAGAGGVTAGLKTANATVLAAVEKDPIAAATYAANHPEVRLFTSDITDVEPVDLLRSTNLVPGELELLAACAPCQGYSTLGPRRPDDPRNDLVLRVADFVEVIRPRTVAFENVPQLARDGRFVAFLERLRALGYGVRADVVDAADFQVPQRRRRIVVLAADGVSDREVPELNPTDAAGGDQPARVSVRDAFAGLPRLDSGNLLHTSRIYPELVLARIRAVPKDGGSRRDLPPELRLRCHDNLGGNAASVYGRMRWDDVAPTLTTRCTSPSCGRFLHPEEDRAITLLEAAALQTFPTVGERAYHFEGGRMAIEAQIGNAIPMRLAKAIWQSLELFTAG